MPPWASGVEDLLKRQGMPSMPMLTPEELAFDNSSQILAIVGAFFAVAALIVLTRVYVRLAMLKVFGTDDYVIVFSMLMATAVFACFVFETHYGLGKHNLALMMDPMNYMRLSKILYVHSILVMVGVSSVKISIAFFLLRLSTRTPYSRFLYGIILFIVLLTIACAMSLIFQCFPVAAAWDYRLRPPPLGTGSAQCYSTTVFRNLGLMNSSFNIVTDVLFATLPVPLIWKLQLNTRTKISLIGVLSLGWFASAAAIIKAVQQWSVLNDMDWTVHDSFNVWNYIEFTIGIIASSLPATKPLFNWFLENARAITAGRTKGSTGYKASGYKGANSLGYHKQSDHSDASIALHSMSTKGELTPGSSKGPYNVRITTKPSGIADKGMWDMECGKKSDESILPLQQPEAGHNRIVRTREVHVG